MEVLGASKHGNYASVLGWTTSTEAKIERGHDVLIKVSFTDVNPVDLQKIEKPFKPVPFVPGFGGTGVVEQIGSLAPQHLKNKNVCFISPTGGSYATHIVVDSRCVAVVPKNVDMRDAASVPVAGLTAYESLVKVGLLIPEQRSSETGGKFDIAALKKNLSAPPVSPKKPSSAATKVSAQRMSLSPMARKNSSMTANGDDENATKGAKLLVVGGAGGVGSWTILLAKLLNPALKVIATASTPAQQAWCKKMGADDVIQHREIKTKLKGGQSGSVHSIICLAEPTKSLFESLSDAIKPYGNICLVVAGKSIENLNLGFCFFKSVNLVCQTVFCSARTEFQYIEPSVELEYILGLLSQQRIKAPINPDLESGEVSEKFKDALHPKKSALKALSSANYARRGKFVMRMKAGDEVIFIDLKTASFLQFPRKECIQAKVLNLEESGGRTEWKEQASTEAEHALLLKKITGDPKLGIMKVAGKQWTDYQDGIKLEEAENVKKMWGVQLKKREKNVKGEEFLFVDPKTGVIGELSRKRCIEIGFINLTSNRDGGEAIKEAVTTADEKDNVAQAVRQALKLHLEKK